MDVFEYLFLKRLFGGNSNGNNDNNDDEDFLFGLMKSVAKFFVFVFCLVLFSMVVFQFCSNDDIQPKEVKQEKVQQVKVQQEEVQPKAVQQVTVQQRAATSEVKSVKQQSMAELEEIQNKLMQQYEKKLAALEQKLAEQASGKNSTIVGDNVSTAPAGAQRFEVFTEKGEITLHIGMSKESVKALMGAPYTNSVYNSQYRGLEEYFEILRRKASVFTSL